MRFSVFLNGRTMQADADKQFILDMEQHALLAGKLGFDAIFMPDHHFNGYMPVASDSFMFASYLAAKLPDMHFGFSVTTVPLHHPVRFVERINILDHLTRGKLLVGVGSGTTPEEMIGFGVNYKDAGRIAEENLQAAEALWAKKIDDPAVELDGFHQGRVLQRIAPNAYGAKHARLMPVAMKESSITRAAVNGWPAFIPAFTPPKIGGTEPLTHVQKYFSSYHQQLLAAGHSAETVVDALSWTTHSYQCVHLAPTDEQAHREVLEILTSYQEAVDREAAFNSKAEADDANKKTDRTGGALTEEWMTTWCLYGSPETVIKKLRAYQDIGIGNILCGTTTGPVTEQRLAYANQTLRLLAEHVMPAFQGDNQ